MKTVENILYSINNFSAHYWKTVYAFCDNKRTNLNKIYLVKHIPFSIIKIPCINVYFSPAT